jgi:hypothetical protein
MKPCHVTSFVIVLTKCPRFTPTPTPLTTHFTHPETAERSTTTYAHMFRATGLRLPAIDNRWESDGRQCPRPTSRPAITSSFRLAITSSQRSISLPQGYIHSPPFLIWQIPHNPLISESCSSAPCKTTRNRRAQHWPDIHSPGNSRAAIRSTPFSLSFNSKHRHLLTFEEATAKSPSR